MEKKFITYSIIKDDKGSSTTIIGQVYSDFEQAVRYATIGLKDCREIYNNHENYASFVAPYDLTFDDGSKAVEKWVHVEAVAIF